MFKLILIDSNCTLEDDASFDKANKTYFSSIANILNCKVKDIFNFREDFYNKYGENVWEYHEIFWRSLANYFGKKNDPEIIENLYNVFLDFYENVIELYPKTLESLSILKEHYLLVMVANGNSKRLLRLIKKFNLNYYFDDFVISSETPYKKPDKFMFEYALKKYNCAPEETLMIGDRYDNDIIGAQKCGIKTALILRTNKISLEPNMNINYVDNSLERIVNHIKNENIKTAFIVAGGKGSRLGTMGIEHQKCMLHIWNNKPILQYVFETLKKNGCTKVIVAVSHLKEQIINYFGDGHNFGIHIEYVEGEFQSTYDAIYNSLSKLSDTFIYMHGDILFDPALIKELSKQCDLNKSSCVAVIRNKKAIHLTHAQMDLSDNNMVVAIDLTERDERYPYTFLGVGIYYKSDFCDNYDGNKLGMVEKFIDQKLKKGEKICATIYDGIWRHFETVSDYELAKNEQEWAVIK